MAGRKSVAILSMISCVAAATAHAADDEHVVINVVNGYVYVSLGTRDGAAEGYRLELLEGEVAIGVLALDLCGEVVCRAPLVKGLTVVRGMPVRVVKTKPPAPKPTAKAAVAPPPTPRVDETPSGPDELPYREPIPRGYVVKQERISGLVSLGWVGFSVSYGITALAGLGGNDSESSLLLLPVVGPLFYYGSLPDGRDNSPGVYVLSALVQGSSVLSLIVGYHGNKKLVRSDVSFVPVVTRDVTYFGVVARF
jgi:hypothetical protein